MTRLVVRKPPFAIDESVPFQWQPANPSFGLFGNAFTFIAIAFERYLVAATRQALPLIEDAAVAEEADAFIRQEAQHARAHRAHAQAMIANYPGLADTMTRLTATYDALLESKPLEYHLAYIADLEATFTPLFKMVLDNRASLFEGADERVGTLMLWHFVEEIEHRSSAYVVYNAAVKSRTYRLRKVPSVLLHVSRTFDGIVADFAKHVPAEDLGVDPSLISSKRLPRSGKAGNMLGAVPSRELRTMVKHLALAQLPGHNPSTEDLPVWVEQWHAAFNDGDDITTYAGARL